MKKVTYKIMQVLLVALLMLTTFTFNRQDEVKAESSQSFIDSLTITNKNKENGFYNGQQIHVQGTWSLPNDTADKVYKKGDSFSIELPKELISVQESIDLKMGGENGPTLVKGKIKDGRIVFTLTEDIEQLVDRKGGFNLTFNLNTETSEEDRELDLVFKDENGYEIEKETIKVNGQSGEIVGKDNENFIKHGTGYEINNQGEVVFTWFIRVNKNRSIHDEQIHVLDQLSEGHELLEDNFEVWVADEDLTAENQENYKYKETYEGVNEIKSHFDFEIKDDKTGFEIIFKDNDLYWYTIKYQTRYTGEMKGEAVVSNTAQAYGSTVGVIPGSKDEKEQNVKQTVDFSGWAIGSVKEGNFIIEKKDPKGNKPLKNVKFRLEHNIYSQNPGYSFEGMTDENGRLKFSGVREGIYLLKELEAPEGYQKIEDQYVVVKYGSSKTLTYVVENHLRPIDITVTKNWKDFDGEQLEDAIQDVEFQLFADSKLIRQAVLKKNDSELVFKNLPQTNEAGETIEYEVREVPIKGFESSVEKKDNNFVFTNKIATKDLTVHKKWLGANSKSTSAKEDIVVVLSKTVNGTTQEVERKKLTKDMSKVTFKDLPLMDKKGHEINYSIKEIAEGDYKTSVEVISEDEIVISNQIKVNKIDYEVNKKWFNAEGNEVKGDELETIQDIEIELLQNGKVFKTKTLPKGESRLVFKNLDDKDVSGEPYVYTVREKELENFEVKYDHKDRQTDIENHYVVPKTNIKGVKVWKDLEGNDIGSHSAIEIILKANGKEEKRFELAKDSYDFEFENLDVTDKNGKKINYSLEEVEVNGFTSKIELDDENYKNDYKATITNTKEVEKTDIRGRKIWLDAKGAMLDSSLEEAITVDLLRDGEVFRSIELEKGEYEFTFKDLDKTDENGVAYEYEVVEQDLSGFVSHVSYDEETQQFIISNKQKEPEVPEPEEPTDPEVPEPEEPTEPEVPEPEEPTEPEVPEPEEPTKPEVLVPEEPEVEEVDSVNIEPKEPEVEEVDSVNIEPEEPEVEEVLEAYVLPQTGQGVSGIVYTGLAGFILGLFFYLKDRKDQ